MSIKKNVGGFFDCGTYVGSHRGKEIKHSIGDDLPKREWVGLTDEEKADIAAQGHQRWKEYAEAVEAKLKEKNT